MTAGALIHAARQVAAELVLPIQFVRCLIVDLSKLPISSKPTTKLLLSSIIF